MFIEKWALTAEKREKISHQNGKILLGLMERRSIKSIATDLKLSSDEVEHNIDEMLYELYQHVGLKRFLKTIFRK
jgi:hypothetical protein